jgi:hypothetical protein
MTGAATARGTASATAGATAAATAGALGLAMVKLLSVIGDRNAKKDDGIEAKSEIVRRFCCSSFRCVADHVVSAWVKGNHLQAD